MSTRQNFSPNWKNDAIAAIFIVIDNESAAVDLKASYKKISILMIN
jgi:hypothetical protein